MMFGCAIASLCNAVVAFLWHISPALVGVGLGSYVLQKFFVSRKNEADFIDNLIDRLARIEDEAIEYWALGSEGEASQARLLEQKIKGAIKSLADDLAYYSKRYDKTTDYVQLSGDLLDACTRGDFESASHKPDSARHIFVVNATSRMRTALLRRKL